MDYCFQRKYRWVVNVVLMGCLLLFGKLESKAFKLSDQAELSLITCSPGNNAATVYGHTAIRVLDPQFDYDLIFNYGVYDFEAPNFLYRFASGQTDYKLEVRRFNSFVQYYKRSERNVYQQVLNLTAEEKQKIVDFLIWNAKKENCVYRYNFFFDNCASRVRDVFADNVVGGIAFREENHSHLTLRELVDSYHGKLLWLTFLIDMAVSADSDREATFWEEMFLPDYLMNHFGSAQRGDGTGPMVKDYSVIYEAPVSDFKSLVFGSPFIVIGIITLLVFFFSHKQYRKGKMNKRWDFWIYSINGLIGIVLSWLAIYSEHPAMSPNYNLFWAIPLNFLFALVLFRKRWQPFVGKYHLVISAWLVVFLCISPFLPQRFHPAFYWLVVIVLCRSVFHTLLIFKKKRVLR